MGKKGKEAKGKEEKIMERTGGERKGWEGAQERAKEDRAWARIWSADTPPHLCIFKAATKKMYADAKEILKRFPGWHIKAA